jgi:hypothetical protein
MSPEKNSLSAAVARPIVHPGQYRKKAIVTGVVVVVAIVVYFLLGLLPFLALLVVGGGITYYRLKARSSNPKRLSS